MKLRTETVVLSTGAILTIQQANWDIDMELDEQRRLCETQPLNDPRFQFFMSSIYIFIASCTVSDHPDLQTAYEMLESNVQDLSKWFMAVQRVNSRWFSYVEHYSPIEIAFEDDSVVVVQDGNQPDKIMKLWDLEDYAQKNKPDDLRTGIFRSTFYPKMAACSTGEVPDEQTAREMPTEEVNKWYEAAKLVNPHWFQVLEDIKAGVDKAELKKKQEKLD